MYNDCLSDCQRFCELFLCLATILITTILINNNNQVTPSLSKPHELSYRPNRIESLISISKNYDWFEFRE